MVTKSGLWHQITTKAQPGFTLVELLIVIVVIAILATITIVAYGNITQKAHATVLQGDLKQASSALGANQAINGSYPADQTSAGLKSSPGNTLIYNVSSDKTSYCLEADGYGMAYVVSSDNDVPMVGYCNGSVAEAGTSSVYASDDFNRADSTNLGTVAVGGFTWQSSTPGQIWSISSNKLVSSSAIGVMHTPIVYVDAGQANGVAQVTVSSIENDCAGIVMHYNTSTKKALVFLGCGDVPGWNSAYTFVDMSTDDVTGGESLAAPSVNKNAADGDVIKVNVNGNTYTGYVNGVQIQQYTTSAYSGTNIGLYDDNVANWYGNPNISTGVKYDDFSWAPLP